MGTIAEKLTYLNETKSELKDSINNLGGNITSETTFREYATELQDIYDNIPKTSGENSNLSLTTIKGRIQTDKLEGNTSQNGTPTPSNPVNIDVVTGEQVVKVENVNLINPTSVTTSNGITTTYNNGVLSYSGTPTKTFAFLTNKIETSLEAGTYTFSRTTSVAYTTIIRCYSDTTNYQDLTILANTTSRSTTFSNNIVAYEIYISSLTSGTAISGTTSVQFEKRKYCNYLYTTPRTNTSS